MMSPLVFQLLHRSKILHSETDAVSLNWKYVCVDVFFFMNTLLWGYRF